MLAFATIVVTTALVLVELNQQQEVTRSLLYYGAAYLTLFGTAHIAVRWLAPYADPLILPCVALLNGLGLVLIYRLDLVCCPAPSPRSTARRSGCGSVGWASNRVSLPRSCS